VRQFRDKPVPPEVLEKILEAGRLAPSGGNEQPWRFGAIRDRALIAEIAEIAYHQTWIASAPLLIVLCTTPVGDARGGRDIQKQRYPAYADQIAEMDQGLYWAINQEEHQSKIAGTQMALVALEHGVGCCWISRFRVIELAERLRLPSPCLPAEILALGYPDRQRAQAAKKSQAEVVFCDTFDQVP
jgi:nitroreductase